MEYELKIRPSAIPDSETPKKNPNQTERGKWAWHLRVPIGTPRVPIVTLKCEAHFPLLVQFGLFFRSFLSLELHLDLF